MISGDSKTVADSVAKRIGIDEVAAEVLPADKASAVKRFQTERMWPLSQPEACWCASIHEMLRERSNCLVLPIGR
jgi:hypothetical protein